MRLRVGVLGLVGWEWLERGGDVRAAGLGVEEGTHAIGARPLRKDEKWRPAGARGGPLLYGGHRLVLGGRITSVDEDGLQRTRDPTDNR